jgi:ABC-type sugar transport system ATPase subunit
LDLGSSTGVDRTEELRMISVQNLSVVLGNFMLREVSFEVPTGGYGVLMGKTGSGKTTILECVCGLRPVQSGRIVLGGRDVTELKPGERGLGYVPQDGALFPSMTVREHLAFAPAIRRWDRATIEERVDELAALLDLRHLLDRRPEGLSGGEIQRVALGRGLACRPGVICLDEPLGALDDETHDEMCQLLKSVQEQTGVTALHVTHSTSEMRRLADRLFVLRDGAVVRLAPEGGGEGLRSDHLEANP